jgi:hypothetical protein
LPSPLSSSLRRAAPCDEDTTFILHAHSEFAFCETPQQEGLDCETVLPTTDATGLNMSMVYMFARHYEWTNGIACAFDWQPTWTILGNSWDCQVNQLLAYVPTAPGPLHGMIMTAFDPIASGALTPIGRMMFTHSGGGCLRMINSIEPCTGGCGLANEPGQGCTHVPEINRGRICVGPGGYHACNPASTPVEDVFWGRIKSQYR